MPQPVLRPRLLHALSHRGYSGARPSSEPARTPESRPRPHLSPAHSWEPGACCVTWNEAAVWHAPGGHGPPFPCLAPSELVVPTSMPPLTACPLSAQREYLPPARLLVPAGQPAVPGPALHSHPGDGDPAGPPQGLAGEWLWPVGAGQGAEGQGAEGASTLAGDRRGGRACPAKDSGQRAPTDWDGARHPASLPGT